MIVEPSGSMAEIPGVTGLMSQRQLESASLKKLPLAPESVVTVTALELKLVAVGEACKVEGVLGKIGENLEQSGALLTNVCMADK